MTQLAQWGLEGKDDPTPKGRDEGGGYNLGGMGVKSGIDNITILLYYENRA